MAESNENPLTDGLSGSIGRELTYRQRAGKTIVSKFPRPTIVPPTHKLRSVRTKFASCIAYAKAAIKEPTIKALYQAASKGGQTAFNVATSDALNAPQVTGIQTDSYHGNPGDQIIVQATDDFKVADVRVSIQTKTGRTLEKGIAVLKPDTMDWLYKATKPNPKPRGSVIEAVVTDLPGNCTSFRTILG
jgi:hypothetical protein